MVVGEFPVLINVMMPSVLILIFLEKICGNICGMEVEGEYWEWKGIEVE